MVEVMKIMVTSFRRSCAALMHSVPPALQQAPATPHLCRHCSLRVRWTAQRPSQSILKEMSPEYSLEGLMLKMKLQYFGHLIQRTDSFE